MFLDVFDLTKYIIKMNFICFSLFNVAIRKFKITSVIPIVFLLNNIGLSRAFNSVTYGC